MRKSALFAVVVCAALGAIIVTAVAQEEESPRVRRQRTDAERAVAAQRSAQFRSAIEAQVDEEGQPAAEGQPFRGRQPAVGGQRDNPLGDGGDSRFGTRSRRAEVQAVAAPASPGRAVTIELLMVELSADAKDAKAAIDLGASADDIRLTVEKLAGEGKLQLVSHIRLSTLEQLPATFQVGEMVPVVTGRQVVGGGRGGVATAASVSYENVGTIVSVTPGIDGDDAILEITAEKSRVENQQLPETDDASTPLPPRRSTSTVRSTVRVPHGSYVVAGGATFAGEDGRKEMLVLVTARF